MTMTKEQIAELVRVVKPVVDWLEANAHPHASVLVNQSAVSVIEDVASVPFVLEPLRYVGDTWEDNDDPESNRYRTGHDDCG